MRKDSILGIGKRQTFGLACGLIATFGLVYAAVGQVPAPAVGYLPRDAAVHYAMQNNPALMTVRKQMGFAEAAIVIAKTYPFNPVYTGYVAHNSGPADAGITNRVYTEDYVTLELELRGQGKIRKCVAAATASRIEWEIAQQELLISIATVRAYNAVLYRQKKLELVEEGIRLGEMQYERLRKAVEGNKAKATDLALARADLEAARAQSGQARTVLAGARSDLRRVLGTLDDSFVVSGALDVPLPTIDPTAYTSLALDQRPDLRARRAAICESENALRLVEANRYGNPSFGPFYEYDPTRVNYVGARLSMPLPVLNTRKGEILKAQTEVAKVRSEVSQMELQISQDVLAALARFANASRWAGAYDNEVLPGLRKAREEQDKLLADNDPALDFARFLVVQRAYLKASDSLLDARFEVSQAEADLALAVADPMVALGGSAAK